MNDLFVTLGIEGWKRLLSGLVMPPVPFLVLVLVGAGWMARRRVLGWSLVLLGVASIWITSTTAGGEALMRLLLSPPPALTPAEIADLRRHAATAPRTTIVVLGAGRELQAPEYGLSTLSRLSVERLRYGLWLARETGLPVGFAGGVGHGADPGPTEAELAQRIAEREFGHPLRWVETESRDTHENALRTVRVIAPLGFERIVLVTHGFHMPRAVAAFERAAARQGIRLAIVPAPLGMGSFVPPHADGLLPSAQGFELTRLALHEWLGRLAGA